MQSGWAIGYAAASLVNAIVQPAFGWRAVFFVGMLPAFFTLWVRRNVEEPAIWRPRPETGARAAVWRSLFKPPAPETDDRADAHEHVHPVCVVGFLSVAAKLPACSQWSREASGSKLLSSSGFILVMQAGMWLGYVTFGFVSDRIGRKRTYVAYLLAAAALLFLYVSVRTPILLLALGPFVAFFATGYFSGFGAVTAEIYPTAIRAGAQGFTYNLGRIASAAAPWAVGTLAQSHGYGAALSLSSLAFLLAAFVWIWIPETRGRQLA